MDWCLSSPGLEYDRDEGLVVHFNRASGDTHLVSALASRVLRELTNSPLTEQQLRDRLAGDTPEAEPAEHALLIEDLLLQLESIHLVERA